jgi:MFS family permease
MRLVFFETMLANTRRNLSADQPTSATVAGLIVVPQIVAALLSHWVGYHSQRFGRKSLLLAGFVIEVVRALLFATSVVWLGRTLMAFS